MPTITYTRGLPGSGKSTYAKAEAAAGRAVRISMDEIRKGLGLKFGKSSEKIAYQMRDAMIRTAIHGGNDVIVDATHLNPSRVKDLRALAVGLGCDLVEKRFDADVEECVKRDALRPEGERVGEKVIRRFWRQWIKPEEKALPHDPEKPTVILVDCDGTLADFEGVRSPYDTSDVSRDRFQYDVWDAVRAMANVSRCQIIFVSGREETCRKQTEAWLSEYTGIDKPTLYMRPAGDSRPDDAIKEEILRLLIWPFMNVRCVFDDRDRVVRMWRRNGIRTFQVAEGAF